ncbi:hypothetical protein [Gracilibacillus thailandensis]|uniref:Uncharacterized protein n=1 Tax=Gracilibacillus thailandensis TaxID=563735 RepID=A0A6N7R027_9BACI|nr:hypothetical protein [Gracilibacillus thailandensis]MRI67687.1 hypothetical protein [Gracilibacillus thailandensis]
MKRFSWLSYWSISLSVLPIILCFLVIYGHIPSGDFIVFLVLLFVLIAISVIFGAIAIVKPNEGNWLGIFGILIALVSGVFIAFGLMMSQMA